MNAHHVPPPPRGAHHVEVRLDGMRAEGGTAWLVFDVATTSDGGTVVHEERKIAAGRAGTDIVGG